MYIFNTIFRSIVSGLALHPRPGRLPSYHPRIEQVAVHKSDRPVYAPQWPCVGSFVDARCAFRAELLGQGDGRQTSGGCACHQRCAARSKDTPPKTNNNHCHSLIYQVICFMSSGMSKTIVTAFMAVISSVRAQGTQWYVTVR